MHVQSQQLKLMNSKPGHYSSVLSVDIGQAFFPAEKRSYIILDINR